MFEGDLSSTLVGVHTNLRWRKLTCVRHLILLCKQDIKSQLTGCVSKCTPTGDHSLQQIVLAPLTYQKCSLGVNQELAGLVQQLVLSVVKALNLPATTQWRYNTEGQK